MYKRILFVTIILVASIIFLRGDEAMALEIKSSAFKEGETIPAKYTCKGADLSPPLSWSNVPDGTKSLALICDDPDAPMMVWVHWVIYNIPAEETELFEALPKDRTLPNGAHQGITDFRRIGYGGPCPPPGNVHRYYFKLYALSNKLNLEPGATKKDLLKAMEGQIIEEAQIMGRFKR